MRVACFGARHLTAPGRWTQFNAGDVVTPTSFAAFSGARQPGVIRASESWANVSVREVATFDEPYNLRLHPTAPRGWSLPPSARGSW